MPDLLDELATDLALSAVVFRRIRHEKQADFGQDLNSFAGNLMNPASAGAGAAPYWEAGRNALIGAGVGGLAGAVGIGGGSGKNRHAMSDALRMGLLGGATFGGTTLGWNAIKQQMQASQHTADAAGQRAATLAASPGSPDAPLRRASGGFLDDLNKRYEAGKANLDSHDYGDAVGQVVPESKHYAGRGELMQHPFRAGGDVAAYTGGAAGGVYLGGKADDLLNRPWRPQQILNALPNARVNPDFVKKLQEAPQSRLPGTPMFKGIAQFPNTTAEAAAPGIEARMAGRSLGVAEAPTAASPAHFNALRRNLLEQTGVAEAERASLINAERAAVTARRWNPMRLGLRGAGGLIGGGLADYAYRHAYPEAYETPAQGAVP